MLEKRTGQCKFDAIRDAGNKLDKHECYDCIRIVDVDQVPSTLGCIRGGVPLREVPPQSRQCRIKALVSKIFLAIGSESRGGFDGAERIHGFHEILCQLLKVFAKFPRRNASK